MEFESIRIWTSPDKRETRVYVNLPDRRSGCYYLTGNRFNPKGSYGGNLTTEEWAEARRIAVRDGKWHTTYPDQMQPATRPVPQTISLQKTELRRNRYADHCIRCGHWVPVGEGYPHQDQDDDSWHVVCADTAACDARIAAAQQEKVTAEARQATLEAERAALVKRVAAATGLGEETDWSWDDFRYSVGMVLAESEHFRAHEYKDGDEMIGFVVKPRNQ